MATRAEIMEKLGEVQHMLNIARHNRKEQEAATDANVARVLALLRLKSEISVEEMSTVLGISPDSLGTTLGNMANDDLVVVTKDEDDNVQSVTLGEKGQEEQPKPRDLQNVALDGFTDDEVDTLGAFLDRIEAGQACAYCGGDMEQHGGSGRPRRFCSERCRRQYWRLHRPEQKRKEDKLFLRTCAFCGKTFQIYGKNDRTYCCREHYRLHFYGSDLNKSGAE